MLCTFGLQMVCLKCNLQNSYVISLTMPCIANFEILFFSIYSYIHRNKTYECGIHSTCHKGKSLKI